METRKIVGFCAALFCTTITWSQQAKKDIASENHIVKYTLVERFEPELALTVSERERLKAERFTEIDSKLRMLDTMDISDRRREKLMEALLDDPFSPKLDKVFAEIEFEVVN